MKIELDQREIEIIKNALESKYELMVHLYDMGMYQSKNLQLRQIDAIYEVFCRFNLAIDD